MSLDAGLAYINSLQPFRGGGCFGLTTTQPLMRALGDPQDKIRTIHIAGTNGKGSVSATIASILGAAGHSVGLTISPHLSRMNERLVVDGVEISDQELSKLALEVKAAADREGLVPTMHEGLTAIAFLHFYRKAVDFAVIEVGVGGRFDSSNVIKRSEVAVIVSIDFDHEHLLGNTYAAIAYEKAGIIRSGVPVVLGQLNQEARQVMHQVANDLGAEVIEAGVDFAFEPCENSTAEEFGYHSARFGELCVSRSLMGRHQNNNNAIAITVAKLLGISSEACLYGCAHVFWPARLEIVNWGKRRVLLDCAHNPHGIDALMSYLDTSGHEFRGAEIAFGVLSRKRWADMLSKMAPYFSTWNLLLPDSDRALPTGIIKEHLSSIGITATEYGDRVEQFLSDAAEGEGRLVITGSMYLIGNIRKYMNIGDRPVWSRTINR